MGLIIFLLAFVVVCYLLDKYLHNYWNRHGVKQLNPSFFVGDAAGLLAQKISLGEFFENLYKNYKNHRLIGIYITYLPVIVINDPMLAKDILIKDFSAFHDRPIPVDQKNDPLSGHLFGLAGKKWKDLRVKLSPAFTSGKLRSIFPVVKDCGQKLETYLTKSIENGQNVIEFRDLLARYSTNIISSVAFGIDNDCINDPNHIFRKMGAKIFDTSLANGIREFLTLMMPQLFHKLKLKTVDQDVEDFMFSIVKQTIEHRENNKIVRNDIMQMLIQLKNDGFIDAEQDSGETSKLSLPEVVAQAFIFFGAGKVFDLYSTSLKTSPFKNFHLS